MVNFFARLNGLYFDKVNELSKISTFKLIFFTVLADVLVAIIFSFLLFPTHTAGPSFDTKKEEFLIAVFFAPFVETLIFQHSIISYLLNKRPNAFLFSCIFSALLFGLSHSYSPQYIFKTFFSGLILGTLFLVVNKKNGYAIFEVSIAHSIFNLIAFCLRNF